MSKTKPIKSYGIWLITANTNDSIKHETSARLGKPTTSAKREKYATSAKRGRIAREYMQMVKNTKPKQMHNTCKNQLSESVNFRSRSEKGK